MRKSFHVGATPKLTLSASTSGLRTSTAPTITSRAWVARSVTARTMFSPEASFTPTTLISESTTITPIPKKMSAGELRSGSQNSPPR